MIAKPFIKWAGGKSWLTKDIQKYLPKDFNNYYEPFLGAGSIFFFLEREGEAFLSDANESLINTYIQIKNNYEKVIDVLSTFENNELSFYKTRAQAKGDDVFEAAKFIYLNKTCFNGIYRVNSRGLFNVPYGHNPNVKYYDLNNIINAKDKLLSANICVDDFEEALKNVKPKDLVFLDPPYTVSHRNNGFIEYNQKIFQWEDQQRLAKCVKRLSEMGVYYILTNAIHTSIFDLYGDLGTCIEIERNSTMSSNVGRRGKIGEYIFTNCV